MATLSRQTDLLIYGFTGLGGLRLTFTLLTTLLAPAGDVETARTCRALSRAAAGPPRPRRTRRDAGGRADPLRPVQDRPAAAARLHPKKEIGRLARRATSCFTCWGSPGGPF